MKNIALLIVTFILSNFAFSLKEKLTRVVAGFPVNYDDDNLNETKFLLNFLQLKHTIMLVTTSTHLEGYKIIEHLGVVRGIIVRSRNIFANIAGGLQTLLGGNISIYTELCERTRQDAYNQLVEQAAHQGANAIINMRYDANEIMQGVTEVLAYGTAVRVEKI